MLNSADKLMEAGCSSSNKDKVCRSRGGESCAFDGAMIVLQPIADAAHIVHGPIACCGNSWEGRGSLARGDRPLHRMGFTTDMTEMDIVYGSETKLREAITQVYIAVRPKAIFVYATCVSGLIGEDIDSVCREACKDLGIPVIPVNAPGFVGPKNLGNRIAGEVLLDYVIGTGEPPLEIITPPSPAGNHNSPCPPLILRGGGEAGGFTLKRGESEAGGRYPGTSGVINLIGEYNIAGDLRLVEPVLKKGGIRVLSRLTGDATYEEITYAHRAKLNVLVCSRALINVAKEMEKKYGIPYIEVSFFGKTEMSKALRLIGANLGIRDEIERVISDEEDGLARRLNPYEHLRGKKAVLYTGGVKSWSFIATLLDLGIEVVAVGTKKSTFHDEEKMKKILGEDAPLVEDVTPANLRRLLKERNADMLIAGGRNQYLSVKEGYPFVDVNQERHIAYAGYDGLLNLAEQISNSINFYGRQSAFSGQPSAYRRKGAVPDLRTQQSEVVESGLSPRIQIETTKKDIVINPLKHSQSMGAAIALQGVDRALPVIHSAQGCSFLGKALITKHFREPIALVSTKLFAEDVVMGSDENISKVVKGFIEKNNPDLIGVLTSGLSEVKGDDLSSVIRDLNSQHPASKILHISTPDYEGGLETGYAKAVETLLSIVAMPCAKPGASRLEGQINVLAGSHLTPADFTELRETIESFGLRPVMLPDLSALDGSRQGISPLAVGGTTIEDISSMAASEFTVSIGASMERAAMLLKKTFDVGYRSFESLSGLKDTEMFLETLSMLSGRPVPVRYERQRRILLDGMRDAHFYFGNKRVCIALEPDLALQTAKWLNEMGAVVDTAVVPQYSPSVENILSERLIVGDLFSLEGKFDAMISNSHAEDTAKRLDVPLYQMGFPTYKILLNNSRVTIGYRGTLTLINEVANLLMKAY